jgi:hypothetical protein
MKSIKMMIAIGLMGLMLFICACSQEQDYSKNFTAPNDPPEICYDMVKYEKGVLTCAGWSTDKEDGVSLKKVLVYVDGKAVGEAKLGGDRPDVAAAFKNNLLQKSGWNLSASIPLAKGSHTSMALSYDSKDALRVVTKEFQVQ